MIIQINSIKIQVGSYDLSSEIAKMWFNLPKSAQNYLWINDFHLQFSRYNRITSWINK